MSGDRTSRVPDPVLGKKVGEDEEVKGGVRYYWDPGQKTVMAQEPEGSPFKPLYDDIPRKLQGRVKPYG